MPQTIEERVAYLEGRVADQARNQGELREMILHLDQKVDRFREELADRISALEKSTNARITGLEQSVNERFSETNARIDALDQKMSRQFMWMVGIQVAILLAVVGALLGGG